MVSAQASGHSAQPGRQWADASTAVGPLLAATLPACRVHACRPAVSARARACTWVSALEPWAAVGHARPSPPRPRHGRGLSGAERAGNSLA